MSKIKILFIAKHVVYNGIPEGGHQMFNYYLNKFCDDPLFEVGYLLVQKNDGPYAKMKDTFNHKAKDFSITLPLFFRLFTFVYYQSFLRFLFSFIKAEWYFLDPIYGFFYKKAIRKLKNAGWAPDVVAFEWTEVIFLKEYYDKFFKSYSLATEQDITFMKMYRRFGHNRLLLKLFLDPYKKTELKALSNFDTILVVSNVDGKSLEDCGVNKNKIMFISAFYKKIDKKQNNVEPKIIFFGAMNRLENTEAVEWFIENVYTKYSLADKLPFIVMGAKVPEKLIDKYRDTKGVQFTGFVEKPEDYFETALCMVVPLLNGGGIKIKILEAMSASVTVITNDYGIEGFPATSGQNYFHCVTGEDYHTIILKLLSAPQEAKIIGESGRKLVLENFNFENSFLDYKKRITDNVRQ